MTRLECEDTHTLLVKVGRLAVGIQKVAVDPGFVDPVQLALIAVEICLAERPCLGEQQLLQRVADAIEMVECISEALVDLSLSDEVC